MANAPLGDLLPYLTGAVDQESGMSSKRESVLAFAAKQAELDFIFKD
jgi:hypothetical protein